MLPSPEINQAIAEGTFEALPSDAFVKAAVVDALFGGISHDTRQRWIKAGRIPEPRKIDGVNYWAVGQLRQALVAMREAA